MKLRSISGQVLWEGEAETVREALQKAVNGKANLSGVNLHGADLYWLKLWEAYMPRADLSGADIRGSSFAFANLTDVDLTGAVAEGCCFYGANLRRAEAERCWFRNSNFENAMMAQGGYCCANMSGCNFTNAILIDSDLRGANLFMSPLDDANDLGVFYGEVDPNRCHISEILPPQS